MNKLGFVALLPLIVASAPAPAAAADLPLVAYVSSARLSPTAVAAMDTNGEILRACRTPLTRSELEEQGVEVTASQLHLLAVMDLLEFGADGRWRTAIPLLDGEQSAALRARAVRVATALAAELEPQVTALTAALAARGFEDYAHAVLFSYVLDGMAWGFFEELGHVTPRRISARRPLWAGEVWALEPARDAVTTISSRSGGVSLRATLGGPHDPAILALLADRTGVREGLASYVAAGRVESEAVRERWAGLGLVDEQGTFRVLVIDEVNRDEVARTAEALTERLVDEVVAGLEPQAVQAELGLRDASQALVIAYHELMWELMAVFEKAGTVSRPAAVDEGRPVAGRVLVVDRAVRRPPGDVDPPDDPGDDEGDREEEGR